MSLLYSLCSSSKGNCHFVGTPQEGLLIDGGIGIRVLDNGIGIPAAERHRIFDRFRRIPAGSQRTGATGFGLGLNFVQQVVRAHGGTVTVESDGSSFSRFTLTLPPPPAPAR